MAEFLAYQSTTIDAANMWSSDGGSVFVAWADVNVVGNTLRANGKTIAVNQNISCTQIDTLTSGGVFNITGTRTIAANIVAGTSACVVATGTSYTLTITGNITGGSATSSFGISCATAITINITGNILGGAGQTAHGIYSNFGSGAAQQINIIGNTTGGSGYASYGIYQNYCNISIIGNVSGGSNSQGQSVGVINIYIGLLQITGSLINTIKNPAVKGPIQYSPGNGHYIQYQYDNTADHVYYYSKTVAVDNILSGIYGTGTNLPAVGTYLKPTRSGIDAVAGDMLEGVTWGAAPSSGVYHEATQDEVISTVLFGPYTGDLGRVVQPNETTVKKDVLYGPNSNKTGTFYPGQLISSGLVN